MSKRGYFAVFQCFMQQNSELQAKHTICLWKNLNMSKMGYFRVFQRFMHQTQKWREITLFVKTSYSCVFSVFYEQKKNYFDYKFCLFVILHSKR
ncbi:hypothetical protein E2C01_099219 [Portunus trituberculatus]|uniref:Uncharacterized protein n=1 Tax=Portunus trituberculatus TaxID=210409 RepID=A0A5B7KEC2_PORTR|nr:hypothetical protein [Portunus trituberculatus]